jgi:hypothetical protein
MEQAINELGPTSLSELFLVQEAVASTALSHDPDMQTHWENEGGAINDEESTMDTHLGVETAMSEFNYEQADANQAQVEDTATNEASAAEARTWLQNNPEVLPEGVTVGARGRLSTQAREAFTNATGRQVK